MKRGGNLKRTELKRGTSQLARSGRLPPMSKKTIERIPLRKAVVAEVMARDKDCVAKLLVPQVQCFGAQYVHEPAQRSICPGSHLSAAHAVRICSAHDNWLESHITEAHELGLLIHSWDAPPPPRDSIAS